MNDPIDQHTNPRMILKNFKEKGKPLHLIEAGNLGEISIDKASVIPNFYTANFLFPNDKYKYEKDLGKIENGAALVFQKFLKNVDCAVKDYELKIVLEFVAWQYLRSKESRESSEGILRSIINDEALLQKVTKDTDFYLKCMEQNFDLVLNELSSKLIGVIRFPDDDFLVTSDSPVLSVSKEGHFSSSMGIGSAEIVVYPFSRNMMLSFTSDNQSPPNFNWTSHKGLTFTQSFNLILYKASNYKIYCHPSDSTTFIDLISKYQH